MDNQQSSSVKPLENPIADFLSFKFMLLEVIAPVLFCFAVLGLAGWSFSNFKYHPGMSIFGFIFGFLVIRIFFELIMVAFAILATLRQIRDKLPSKFAASEPPQENQ